MPHASQLAMPRISSRYMTCMIRHPSVDIGLATTELSEWSSHNARDKRTML